MKKLTALLLVLVLVLTAVPAVGAENVTATVSPYNLQIGTTQTVSVASVGDHYQLSDGTKLPFTLSYGGTTYLPLRKVADLLGIAVGFDGATKTVKIGGSGSFKMEMPVAGSTYTSSLAMNMSPFNITVNGEAVAAPGDVFTAGTSSVPFSLSYNNTTYLPLRKLGELLGVTVGYDAATKTVQIKKALTAAELEKAEQVAKEAEEQAALAAEAYLADQVQWIRERKIARNSTADGWDITFMLTRTNQDYDCIKVSCDVDVYVTNDDGQVVYEKTHKVKPTDFIRRGGNYVALIKIYDTDLTPGSNEDGTVAFKCYRTGFFSFNEYSYTVYGDLPLKTNVNLTVRTPLPKVLAEYDYRGRTESLFTVTDISYKVKRIYDGTYTMYLYFTGEKSYDENGSGQSASCKIGWKLYDEDGYTIDSGTCYTANIAPGEKFRNAEEIIFDLYEGNYYLEILSTN